jgi:hypothetical protein
MNGKIRIESAPNQGTAFTFIIPFTKYMDCGRPPQELTEFQKDHSYDEGRIAYEYTTLDFSYLFLRNAIAAISGTNVDCHIMLKQKTNELAIKSYLAPLGVTVTTYSDTGAFIKVTIATFFCAQFKALQSSSHIGKPFFITDTEVIENHTQIVAEVTHPIIVPIEYLFKFRNKAEKIRGPNIFHIRIPLRRSQLLESIQNLYSSYRSDRKRVFEFPNGQFLM